MDLGMFKRKPKKNTYNKKIVKQEGRLNKSSKTSTPVKKLASLKKSLGENILHSIKHVQERHKEDYQDVFNLNTNFNKVMFSIVGVFCLVLTLTYLIYSLYTYSLRSKAFNIDEISISGNSYLSQEEILDMLGLAEGKNSFDFSLKAMELKLTESPWIDSVRIRRSLPDNIFIDIVERKASFTIIKDNSLFYVDENCRYIEEVDISKYMSLPILDASSLDSQTISKLIELVQKIKANDFPFSYSTLAWIKADDTQGFQLYYENNNILLTIDMHNWLINLSNSIKVINNLIRNNEIKYIKEIIAIGHQVTITKY